MRLASILFVIVFASPWIAAQQTRPTTRPTSAAEPKDALRLLNFALRDGDRNAVAQAFETHSPQEVKLVNAMADYAAALASLHHQAAKSFGKQGANAVTGDTDAESSDGLRAIDKAEVEVDGDSAIVHYKNADDPPVKLKKIGGRWMLPLSQLTAGADVQSEQQRLEELGNQAHLALKTADEIAQGKYKDASDAAQAWQSRLLDVVLASATQKKGE